MSNAVANPRVTLDIIRRDSLVGVEDYQVCLIGQISANAAADITGGMFVPDVPRTDAEINELFGADSHAALLARSFREVNEYSNLAMIVKDDAALSTAATAQITFAGAATKAGTLYVTVVSEYHYTFEVEVEVGDTPTEVLAKLEAVVSARANKPFTFTNNDPDGDFTAVNKGSIANNWPIKVKGRVPGITYTLTGWAGGATDPDISALFDDVQNERFQGIVWPESYATSTIKNFIDPRKNVDNDVKDGMAFMYLNESFVTIKTSALGLNSSEICVLTNKPIDEADWKGPAVPTAPDMVAAYVCAVRALRSEDGISVSDYVSTVASGDQFGGAHMHSLPFFNTPIRFIGLPRKGSCYSAAEQLELEDSGVSVLGANRSGTGVVLGQLVTTWQKDPAGNDDETWKYVNWRDTHGHIREFLVVNCRKRFAQSRLSTGDTVAGFDIATEELVRAFVTQILGELALQALVVAGIDARRLIERSLVVTLQPELRRVNIYVKAPMVSQLGEIIGTVQYTFDTA